MQLRGVEVCCSEKNNKRSYTGHGTFFLFAGLLAYVLLSDSFLCVLGCFCLFACAPAACCVVRF